MFWPIEEPALIDPGAAVVEPTIEEDIRARASFMVEM